MTFTPVKVTSATEVVWRFQGNLVASHQGGSDTFGTGYAGRVHINAATSSLELRNLTLKDNGEYTVTMKTATGLENREETKLTVLIPVSVELTANETEVIEFQSTVTVNCTVSGSRFTAKLTGNGGPLSSTFSGLTGQVTISEHKEASRDMETFICQGYNDLGSTSRHLDVKVHYGPDKPVVVATPKGPSYRTGSDIVLSCSSVSCPAAQLQWALNGTLLGREGPELRLENVQIHQSGDYSCWAHNSKTGRNVQSKSQYLRVAVILPGLTDGDIAGIVIGSLLAVAALVVILLLVLGFRCQPSKGFYRYIYCIAK
ncbi:hypothetical protein ACEWY4_019667 [Coilia grayii]|uniref:Ig-like domain-containing protein n=1 Tax=Coilia grayii TaxID=363190 RepID=A0ABD1JAR5_9TELE